MVTREELIEKLIDYADDDYAPDNSSQVSFVEDCIDDAIEEVMNALCPYGIDEKQTEKIRGVALSKYPSTVLRIAKFHYDKQGKEGVTTFYEAGQTNSFESGGTPSSFLRSIIPIARVC